MRYKFTIVRRLHSKRDCIRGMDGLLEKVRGDQKHQAYDKDVGVDERLCL